MTFKHQNQIPPLPRFDLTGGFQHDVWRSPLWKALSRCHAWHTSVKIHSFTTTAENCRSIYLKLFEAGKGETHGTWDVEK
jgi:hypothetical protein